MKKTIFLILAACCLSLQQGCNLTETNIDPTQVHEVELRQLLPAAISQTAFNQSNTTLRIAGTFIQQFSMSGGCATYDHYYIPVSHFDRFWTEGLYGGALKDFHVIIEQAQAEGQSHYEGIAKILMANELGRSSLMFGDLPYSDAFMQRGNRLCAFDTQEQIFETVFQLLDEGISLLEQTPIPGGPAADDLIFQGNNSSWLKTAWALKARYAMQMSKRDPDAANKVLIYLEKAFTSLEEQPSFAWENSLNGGSPLYRFHIERRHTMSVHEQFATKAMEDDPRKVVYVKEIDWDQRLFSNGDSLFWGRPDVSVPIISYVELSFLQTEALWRSGAAPAEVQQALRTAVIASMEQVNLTSDSYQSYVDELTKLANLTRSEQLIYIMEEAYKAYFGYATVQIWANYRRTGSPKLNPHPYGSNGLNPSGEIPKRYLYPLAEETSNPEHIATAKERQNGALMDAPLWIFE